MCQIRSGNFEFHVLPSLVCFLVHSPLLFVSLHLRWVRHMLLYTHTYYSLRVLFVMLLLVTCCTALEQSVLNSIVFCYVVCHRPGRPIIWYIVSYFFLLFQCLFGYFSFYVITYFWIHLTVVFVLFRSHFFLVLQTSIRECCILFLFNLSQVCLFCQKIFEVLELMSARVVGWVGWVQTFTTKRLIFSFQLLLHWTTFISNVATRDQ